MFGMFIKYLCIINLMSMIVFVMDKLGSVSGEKRCPNVILWLLILAGGSFGAFIGMLSANHKTNVSSFRYGVPFAVVTHTLLFALVQYNA